jgi:hypothetical protein
MLWSFDQISLLMCQQRHTESAFDTGPYVAVGRFNYFKLAASTNNAIGSRTDLWFMGERKTPAAREFDKKVTPLQYVAAVASPTRPGQGGTPGLTLVHC